MCGRTHDDVAALTGGHIGLFRPDVSLMGAADILNVIASLLLLWLLLFDFPEGLDRGVGVFLALAGAAVAACGAGRALSASAGGR